jgi:hypothetical protein
MKKETLHLSFDLKKSPEFVFESLSEVDKFVKAHPLIYKMEDQGEGNYLVFEKLFLLGFIPYAFTYPATIQSSKENGSVYMEVDIQGKAQVYMDFVVIGDGNPNSCRVEEKVLFQSKLPIVGVMKRLFAKQHKKLFAAIEKSETLQ